MLLPDWAEASVVKEENNMKTNYIPQKKNSPWTSMNSYAKSFCSEKIICSSKHIFSLKREVRTATKWESKKKKNWVECHRMVLHIQFQVVNTYINRCILSNLNIHQGSFSKAKRNLSHTQNWLLSSKEKSGKWNVQWRYKFVFGSVRAVKVAGQKCRLFRVVKKHLLYNRLARTTRMCARSRGWKSCPPRT